MDISKKYVNRSPQVSANPLSKLFFWWILPFVKYGYNHQLEMKDIYNVQKPEMSEDLTDALERNWEKECYEAKRKNIRPSLLTALRKTFIVPYVIMSTVFFIRLIVYTYGMPTALDYFLDYFTEVPRDVTRGFYLGGAVLAISIFNILISNQRRIYSKRLAMRIKIACGGLIYRKILKLNKLALDSTDIGNIVNLMSNDLDRFDTVIEFGCCIFFIPVVAGLSTYVMYSRVGIAAFFGIGGMLLQAIFVQGYLSKLQGKFRSKIAGRTDSRVRLMNELTKGIQVLKMYAWEKPFAKIVASLRKKEVSAISNTSLIKGITTSIQVFTERVTLYIIVVAYVLMGNELTGGVVFSLAQIINTLQLVVCIFGPLGLAAFAETKTSISRLEIFLLKEEKEEEEKTLKPLEAEVGLIRVQNIFASWINNPISETLINVSFELPPGSFCCVVGNVGSGKSSLLQLLLKELPISSGNMLVNGRISYASQEPWLFVSNIRNNILFGQPYIKDKYNRVVEVCALERDFDLFPFGDKTKVAEDGVSLSGGQRARINLARAVYRDADIYLFDDPLSAVDTHVAKQLVDKCIIKYLKNKTRILVTHQTQFLNQANFVLIMNNGQMEKFIQPAQLSQNDINLIRKTSTVENLIPPKASQEIFQSTLSLKSIDSMIDDEGKEPVETQELIERGAVGANIFKEYYRAGASVFVLLLEILLIFVAQFSCNGGDLWLTYWTNNVLMAHSRGSTLHNSTEFQILDSSSTEYLNFFENSTPESFTENFVQFSTPSSVIGIISGSVSPNTLTDEVYIQVYTIFIVICIVLLILRSLVYMKICMRASIELHNRMFSNILQAKMRFFDINPSGRILNRFSSDMGIIDEILPAISLTTLQVMTVAGGILMMTFIKSYFMIFPAILLGMAVLFFRRIFFKTAQDVKRMERTAKAPVYSYVAATLRGLATIRASNAEDELKREFDGIQDLHTATNYMFVYVFQAFGFSLDISSFIFLIVLVVQFILNPNVLSGDVGLVLSQSLIVIYLIQYATMNTSELANHMTSVERILQYTKLDKEGPFETLPANKPPRTWPEAGRVTFKSVYLRYIIEEEPVLKNLNLDIEPGEKIGIVGRTGAGKSTLISAIFRLAPTDGTIRIDGVDISKIGLTDLRSKISIIPQEPTLFSESIRYNLDPFGKCHDAVLWNALEAVELKQSIDSLDMIVSEGGSNFSAGQRQLICLARAIVRNNKILVMDEATANVDPHTDSLIQASIRRNFENCTVLTVAHRLNTIMDSDRVIVMEAGQLKEYAPPHELLQNSESYFNKMVQETGAAAEKTLRMVAEEHYHQRWLLKQNKLK